MSTLLLRLAGPLQSWGADAKFEKRRGTEKIPTKSGVIGLLAAALGRHRDGSVEDLNQLVFGVRTDREGFLLRDYHMVHDPRYWVTQDAIKYSYITNRYYLSDALFLAGLEGEDELVEELHQALCHPVFPLYLGRRSCPPEGRLSLGVRKGKTLEEALREEPWLVGGFLRKRYGEEVRLRIARDTPAGAEAQCFQRDLPESFDQTHRRYGFRAMAEAPPLIIRNKKDGVNSREEPFTNHDPLSELGG